jgi:hypothetical protein
MVKGKSFLASNKEFWVRILVEASRWGVAGVGVFAAPRAAQRKDWGLAFGSTPATREMAFVV